MDLSVLSLHSDLNGENEGVKPEVFRRIEKWRPYCRILRPWCGYQLLVTADGDQFCLRCTGFNIVRMTTVLGLNYCNNWATTQSVA